MIEEKLYPIVRSAIYKALTKVENNPTWTYEKEKSEVDLLSKGACVDIMKLVLESFEKKSETNTVL